MKRYVKEFANDYINNYILPSDREAAKKQIDKIINACEKGYITNVEAVREIADIRL